MSRYFFTLGTIDPPSPLFSRALMGNREYRDELIITRGLSHQLVERVNQKLRVNFDYRQVEVRLPYPRMNAVVDDWHRDASEGTEDFWLVLWNSSPMTEFVEWSAPGRNGEFTQDVRNHLDTLPRVPVEPNSVMVIRNSQFAHRRPQIPLDQTGHRWFMRLFPREKIEEFGVACENFVRDSVLGSEYWSKPVTRTTCDYDTFIKAYETYKRKRFPGTF